MMLGDFADDGGLTNNLTRPQNVGMVHLETEENSSPWIASNELVDLRSDDAILDPGDLVEIRCHPLLPIPPIRRRLILIPCK